MWLYTTLRRAEDRLERLDERIGELERQIENVGRATGNRLYREAIEDERARTLQAALRLRAVQRHMREWEDEIALALQLARLAPEIDKEKGDRS